MRTRTKVIRISIVTILSLVLILIVAGFLLSRYALTKAKEQLKSLNATIESVDVNLFNQSVSLNDIAWTYADDSLKTIPHQAKIKLVRLNGVSLYQLIRFKKVHVRTLAVMDGVVMYNKAIKPRKKNGQGTNINLKDILVDKIALKNISAIVLNDSLEEYSGTVNLIFDEVRLKDLKLANEIASYDTKSFELLVSKVRVNTKDAMYNTRVGQIYLNSNEQKITIDSLTLIPTLSKYKFSRKVGRQVDRFNLFIPKVAITGFIFNEIKDSLFAASKVEIIRAKLHVYRDKRLPFIKEKNTPLPIALIRSFSFGASIDTVKITDSHITYEEFPENGFRTGKLTFEKLNATLDHITNRDDYPTYKQATLIASSRLMGKGTIQAEFSLPYGKEQIYNAKGKIRNLPLYHLNPILESLAFVSIESGKLNELSFNFDYNDIRSRGTILVNYEDLRITSLTREKESVTNEFKTWALNLFLKKDKDKSVSMERRMGTIGLVRDRRKAIFNVWVKSLFTGLKSSVLDSPVKKEKESGKGKTDQKKDKKKDVQKNRKDKTG